MTEVLARLEGIERRFGSVQALDGAQLEIRAGEVHGVLGANGAGKSTLLNILGGMLQPDRGSITIGGELVRLSTPRDAWARGIALVHQHFTLVPRLSVLDNLALGGGRRSSLREEVARLVDRTGLRVPFDAVVEDLGVGDRQRIEILKALLRKPRVLVLDEPTAVLTPDETAGLFDLVRGLTTQGVGVVLVVHKLDEVVGVADHITVLRRGRTVLSTDASDVTAEGLVKAMIGDARADEIALGVVPEQQGRTDAPEARRAVVARLDRVGLRGRLRAVDLTVHEGEILGVAGVEGNGQRELALVLSGRQAPDQGGVELPAGIGFVPQDRSTEGLIGSFDLVENVALALHRVEGFSDGPWLRWADLRAATESIRSRFELAAPSVRARGKELSGGNQQRMVVGREITVASELLIAENPTRGLDVEAAAFVHDELRRLAAEGVAIVLVSTDLDEVLGLSDRVVVLARGRIRPVGVAERTREGVGALMLGGVGD